MARNVSSAVFLALYYTVFAFKIDATVSRNMALVCVRSKEAMALTSLAAVTGTKWLSLSLSHTHTLSLSLSFSLSLSVSLSLSLSLSVSLSVSLSLSMYIF